MTNTQAHQFVARWRRILVPWFAKTEAEVLRDMERSCIGMAGGGFLIFLLVSTQAKESSLWLAIAIIAGVQLLFSFGMVLRCRSAKRALAQS